ncbi:hypothetical protein [Duganella vulcania]|uniref:Lipase modulator n=1 Tax=Duganella vulcania TaxID=2692166 RepID=A0A845GMA2_9BURK|nr:hypothetical protein [Duganella vulcania]MYM94580.1 hypothetical protein [Duganella vulcania]
MKAAATIAALAATALLKAWAWREPLAPDSPPAERKAAPLPAKSCAADPHAACAGAGEARRAARHWLDVPTGEGNAPPGLSLTDDQQLIPDFALHQLMDRFLLDRSGAGGMQALTEHLRRALPAAAANEAIQIAARYQAYLTAHDELLAAQHFTSASAASQDLNRISSWQQQRHQLRVRAFGERITLEWFGTEDAYLEQALEEQRQRSEGRPPAADAEPADQAAHDLHMRLALDQAITGYQAAAKAN